MATKAKKSPAKAKKTSGGTTKKATKAPAKKAAPKKTVKKTAAKVVKKAAAKVKKAVKQAVSKSRPAAKKAVKAVKKTVKAVKKTVSKAPVKKATAKKTAKKASVKTMAKTRTTKKPAARKASSKPSGNIQEMPLTENRVETNLPATPVFTEHAENIEPSLITAQAVKTEGVPSDEKHPDHPLFEKPVTPADIATVGMNNKKEILNNLSVKHANNHKLTNQKIAGKKPLW